MPSKETKDYKFSGSVGKSRTNLAIGEWNFVLLITPIHLLTQSPATMPETILKSV